MNIIPFDFEGNSVRTTSDNDILWFNAKDVCTALEYVNPSQSLSDHVDVDDVSKRYTVDSLGRNQLVSYINESGLYALIFGSKKPSAKRFKKWVTSEVLPSIRKTGSYTAIKSNFLFLVAEQQKQIESHEETIKLQEDKINKKNAIIKEAKEFLIKQQEKINNKNKKIEEMKPAYNFVNTYIESDETRCISSIGRLFGFTPQEFFSMLERDKIMFYHDKIWTPYHTYVRMGFFIIKLKMFGGKPCHSARVTATGTLWLAEKYGIEVEK